MFGIPYAWRTLRRIVVPVEKNLHPTDGPRPRGAKAVIDESTAARLSAVVGDGEFSEFAGAAHGAPEGPATTTAALIRRNTPAAAIAVATLACLWVGNRMNHSLPDTVAHAGDNGGSFGEPTAAAGPMFGAGRDPGARGGDPAMNLKNSARVAVLAVTAAVTANGALAGDAVQWRVEDGGNGHWYRTVTVTGGVTWESARQSAALLGGQLTCLESDLERTFCFTRFSRFAASEAWVAQSPGAIPDFGPWIGGYQLPNSAEPLAGWTWITGSMFNPSWPWACCNNDCPGSSNEDRLHMFFSDVTNETSWNDLPNVVTCGAQPISFLVEWSADCNSDGIVDYGQCHDGTLPDYNGNNIPDCCEQGVQCTVGKYPVQWRVEDGGNGHWYLAVHPSPMPATFASQDEYADSVGAQMATLTSSEENEFAISLLSGAAGEPNGAHFGLRRVGNTTAWQWVGGQTLTWNFWGSSSCFNGPYPNNLGVGGEMGAMLYKQNCGWVWDDAWPSYNVSESTIMLLIEWSADCNQDGIVDYGQILTGTLPDTNTNNIPDCCEPGNNCCVGDIYVNHIIDGGDLGVLLSEWGAVTPTTNSDLNRDGFVNGADLGMLLANWGPCGG